MDVVFNEATGTVHRRGPGSPGYESVCGATYHVPGEKLTVTSLATVLDQAAVSKCGRCFEEAGGY